MIKLQDVINKIYTALSTDSQLITYCQTTFSKKPTFNLSGTGRQSVEETPSISIIGWNKSYSDTIDIEISIMIAIEDQSYTESTSNGIKKIVYNGPTKLENIMIYIQENIINLASDFTILDYEHNIEPLEFFPLFIGSIDFTLSFPRMLGNFEPTIT